jgi:hypothetical protein
LGVYCLPFEAFSWLSGRQDGEWLGEEWPLTEAMGFWLLGCIVALVILRKRTGGGGVLNQSFERAGLMRRGRFAG